MRSLMSILKDKKGVTLIELLVVVVILGIIAAVAIPAVMGNQTTAYENTNEQNQEILEEAVARYNINNATNAANDISVLTSSTSTGGPYMSEIPQAHLTTGGTEPFTLVGGVVTPPTNAY